MIKYIFESATRAQQNQNQYEMYGRITVQITNPLPSGVSIKNVIKKIESELPEHVMYDVDSIYIGNYDALNKRNVDSMYISGTILVSNEQETNKMLFDTLIHEFAHAVEDIAKDFIYNDGQVASEFLNKRAYLFNVLKNDYEIDKKTFLNINFNQSLDDFFNKEIGYDNLGVITSNLFLSPYACTSLREYFANGFEHYYRTSPVEVKQISPAVYRKVTGVLKGDYL